RVGDIDAIAFTEGPGLAGALLVGAATGTALAFALGKPAVGVHHLEGHLLSPLLSADPPRFPFVALLVSGGHTQLLRDDGVGRYALLGDTLDDAAGEAFDKSAKLLGLGYPGGPAIARLAAKGRAGRFALPRPMLRSDDLDFSFSGLKTAVLTQVRKGLADRQARADLAAELQAAIVEVLVCKALRALALTGLDRLVIAGGVGANAELRTRLQAAQAGSAIRVYFPEPELCTDNGAMIALAGCLRLAAGLPVQPPEHFDVRPRWPLEELAPAGAPASAFCPDPARREDQAD
ncbi:MAG: tRNA (adenosine(37)-N6)-threonylcarbamoyltransferase complex transferase subunit TsaD, partial [Burkholderiales bacterium]